MVRQSFIAVALSVLAGSANAQDHAMTWDELTRQFDKQTPTAAVSITCRIAYPSGATVDRAFVLDEVRNTVDGQPARFSQHEIQWNWGTASDPFDVRVNRDTGALAMYATKSAAPTTGSCFKTPQRQF